MDKDTIKIGTKVIWRNSWGKDAPREAVVRKIEKCVDKGSKYGKRVDAISWDDKDYGVYDLDNGHWCYGYQIDSIVE